MSNYENLKEISDDLNNILNRLTGEPTGDFSETLTDIEKSMGATHCTWYGECYYCKIAGRWRLVKCWV